jgi:hypothetical protein
MFPIGVIPSEAGNLVLKQSSYEIPPRPAARRNDRLAGSFSYPARR